MGVATKDEYKLRASRTAALHTYSHWEKHLQAFTHTMYKIVFLILALAAFVFAAETQQDQETAEQYYRVHGFYPSWYRYGVVRTYGYPYPYSVNYGVTPYGLHNYYYPSYGYGFSYGY
ncbi:hypothetical protein GHT06_012494 [Daphnia sinensis]|uniref:Uncharacterized protein n=1 Tax=Daphnia sinensis TaxID=1820382 RepID=A0AAD5LF18_9CRUS|nr:hypothetical protein GHT06_012494 [Daphnia sinensis]